MTLGDVDQVMEIERLSFTAPWSARAYRFELTENENSIMLVVRQAPGSSGLRRWLWPNEPEVRRPVLGYAGMWLLVDEGHIATIAVHPDWRGRGLGELLLLSQLERARAHGMIRSTLEVRVTNEGAQALYRNVGFEVVSRRRHYYADNNEDAYIMTTPNFDQPGFWENVERRRARLYARLRAAGVADRPPGTTLDPRR